MSDNLLYKKNRHLDLWEMLHKEVSLNQDKYAGYEKSFTILSRRVDSYYFG